MALLRNNPNGGIMDVIRCDQPSYLIWKWRPEGSSLGEASRENAIRWGSSLRVKNGEVAVFVYHNKGGMVQDHIVGPYDSILKTENLPIIASAIGLGYNGSTPFQAEVYFINLAQVIQIKFGVPYFDVFDPRFDDFSVPISVRGVINFTITDYKEFIDRFQLRELSLDEFKSTVKAAVTKYVKNVVSNAPEQYDIPVIQLERRITDINNYIEQDIASRLLKEFGVSVTSVDISDIEIDKSSSGYKTLLSVTKKQTAKKINFGTNLEMATQAAAQAIGLVTDAAVAKADVEEYQYSKHKKAQVGFIKAFVRGGEGDLSAGEKRPGFSTNVTKSFTGFVNNLSTKKEKTAKDHHTPPPLPDFSFHVVVDGNPVGPLGYDELIDLINNGNLTPESLVWRKGLSGWVKAKEVDDLTILFDTNSEEPPPLPID